MGIKFVMIRSSARHTSVHTREHLEREMSTAMSQSVARVATIHQPATSRRRTVRRAVVTRAEAARDDVEPV